MIHRSAHLGFRPVLKALYLIYWNFVRVQRALHSSVPEDVVTFIEAFTQELERDAMVKLAEAIQRHQEALGSTHVTEQSTVTSTTTTTVPAIPQISRAIGSHRDAFQSYPEAPEKTISTTEEVTTSTH